MDLRKTITDKHGSLYRFAKENNISPQRVNHWVSKDFETLSYKLKQRILNLLN